MTEQKLKQIIRNEHLIKPIIGLLKEEYGVKTSVLVNADGSDEIIRIIEHHENPSIKIDLEEIQITSETKGYTPTGEYNWDTIEILNKFPISEELKSCYFITVNGIFEMSNVSLNLKNGDLSFISAKSL